MILQSALPAAVIFILIFLARSHHDCFVGTRAITGCFVRNLSESGACLAAESPVGIPDAVKLVFDNDDPWRIAISCGAKGERVGVHPTL